MLLICYFIYLHISFLNWQEIVEVVDLKKVEKAETVLKQKKGILHTSKTKIFVVKKKTIEQVSSFEYLGSIISEANGPWTKIRGKIEQSRRSFKNIKQFFIRSDLSLELRLRMIRCHILSILLDALSNSGKKNQRFWNVFGQISMVKKNN